MSYTVLYPKLRRMILAGGPLPAWLENHTRKARIIKLSLSTPPWINSGHFRALREEQRLKTLTTGVPHVLDHIIPVEHPLVCGLTVPWNMQVIDRFKNARKSNSLNFAAQGEIFDAPEQLRMI